MKDTLILCRPATPGLSAAYLKTLCRAEQAWVTTPRPDKARRFTAADAEKIAASLRALAPALRFSTAKA